MLEILKPIWTAPALVAVYFAMMALQHPHEAASILWHWLGANAYWISP